jgi:hypothetical protein
VNRTLFEEVDADDTVDRGSSFTYFGKIVKDDTSLDEEHKNTRIGKQTSVLPMDINGFIVVVFVLDPVLVIVVLFYFTIRSSWTRT